MVAYRGYGALDSELRLARSDGASWSLDVIDSGDRVGIAASLAVDQGGNPVISYGAETCDAVHLRLADCRAATLHVLLVGGRDASNVLRLAPSRLTPGVLDLIY